MSARAIPAHIECEVFAKRMEGQSLRAISA
jgi:hypothetical protein